MPGALAVGAAGLQNSAEPAGEPADQADLANAAARGTPGHQAPVRVSAALPHIASAYVSCWEDDAAYLHIVFFARQAGFARLLGTCLAIWDDLRPAVPDRQRDGAAAAIAGLRPLSWRAGSLSLIWAATGTEQAAVAALSDAAGPI